MPSSLGPAEILVILVVALIVLGPQKLPQAGRQVGKALSEVRRWSQDVRSEVSSAFDVEPPRAPSPPSTPPASPIVASPAPEPPPAEPAPAPDAADTTPAAAGPEAPVDDRA